VDNSRALRAQHELSGQGHPRGSEVGTVRVMALLRVERVAHVDDKVDIVALVAAAYVLAVVASRPCVLPQLQNPQVLQL